MRVFLFSFCFLLCAGLVAAQSMPAITLDTVTIASLNLREAPVRGKQGAPLVVVEISDLQCPACAQAHPVVERLTAEYGGRVEFRYYGIAGPSHAWARPAYAAARCIGEQDTTLFWKAGAHFYEHAREIEVASIDEEARKLAAELGADPEAFERCYTGPRYLNEVDMNLKSAVAAGVRATPSFLVGDQLIAGLRSFDELSGLIDQALEEPNSGGLFDWLR
ncbi:MAG: thioredoxin domain-containing protein [Chrysiogenetes bacterium]|nr:thioredoxin domain-containing protein [Chrysiogenetes bacterium]